ncbi:alpha/beta hydrolase [Helicobacter muridarum]|uniref:2-hydroxy-6-oxohepta-2,4-dienoate hydrolase n=1 Tax=Helicobacter muridarum TaxID=216 RepID=A0A099TUU0_9HELI|nr:alpha/beta hydrolase [Helicobacter muridarum]TLD98029.1 alpha/beta hydrolase [Helicobacter muridarum]STQ87108.1 2-hydroxy-6-oxohepta-2,4-dienoate hydrolase [Helicobacter muridarum]
MAQKNIQYEDCTLRIAYSIIDNQANKNMLFLHGWGSNKEIMRTAFSKYFKNFNHIYVDLPHFGGSEALVFLDTYGYAKVINEFLNHISINGVAGCDVVVGHSFGGKVALLLQKEIILLSSAGILLPKSLKIKLKILFAKLAKILGIRASFLRADDAKGLSPIAYEIFKCVVGEDFYEEYANFYKKATIFWGKDDKATPLKSFQIICSIMPSAKSYVLDGDHYFFLQQAREIDRLYRLPSN